MYVAHINNFCRFMKRYVMYGIYIYMRPPMRALSALFQKGTAPKSSQPSGKPTDKSLENLLNSLSRISSDILIKKINPLHINNNTLRYIFLFFLSIIRAHFTDFSRVFHANGCSSGRSSSSSSWVRGALNPLYMRYTSYLNIMAAINASYEHLQPFFPPTVRKWN